MAPPALEKIVGDLLKAQGLTLSTAEACTGGLIGHRLTNIPGSSSYYLGGVIAYSNMVKEQILKVRRETLVNYGAVSEQTAMEMAEGVRLLFGSDVAIAETGIAGPSGGTSQKPIGLFYVALSAKDKVMQRRFLFESDRDGNKSASAQSSLELLETYLHERIK